MKLLEFIHICPDHATPGNPCISGGVVALIVLGIIGIFIGWALICKYIIYPDK